MISAGVPPRHAQARLSDFPKPAIDKVESWMSQRNEGLLLTGPVGTGKTYLAAAITRLALDRIPEVASYSISPPSSHVLFRRCADLYSELRSTFNSGEKSERIVLAQYFAASMLSLDDIGAGAVSDFERRILLDVVDTRWGQMRPTVITTNLSLNEIAEKLDDRISSRLRTFTVIVLGGRDRRSRS